MSNIILGIESSCDDTSAAVIKDGILLSNVIASQSVHEAFGGVVPELASRAHQQNIVPVVSEAIKRAGIQKSDLSAIAFTAGPGLIGSLLVGTSFAKGLSTATYSPISSARTRPQKCLNSPTCVCSSQAATLRVFWWRTTTRCPFSARPSTTPQARLSTSARR